MDLTKCINLRYKAKIGDHHVIGRIGFDEDGYVVLLHNGVKPWRGNSVEEIMTIHGMEDFEIVPRDPETYKDWQVGDVIYNLDDEGNPVSGEDEMCRVIFRSGELVAIAENYSAEEADINGCYTCSQLFREGWRLVLTDIEQQIIEGKKKYEPQDGDICSLRTNAGNRFVFIIKRVGEEEDEMYKYVGIDANSRYPFPNQVSCVCDGESIRNFRLATDEEKQLLFDAMAKQGKRWNAEKKVVEDIPKPYEFKKGEPVLVRDNDENIWILSSFIQFIPTSCFHVTNGVRPSHWKQCIPYNEKTMHLLGTSRDYEEER